MNTSAPLFSEQNLEQEMQQQQDELYCKLYALAAEDFTTVSDVNTYVRSLTECIRLMQQQITTLMQLLSNHTHIIPPHTHPIEPHVHTIASAGAGMTDPNILGLITMPTPLQTNVPVESGSIRWTEVITPNYINTTNATPNMAGNMVTYGPSLKGPLSYGPRRAKTPLSLSKPSVPPIMKDLIKP